MKYEYLDIDTQSIIDTMCYKTGKTKEQAILALVEFGMISMLASICQEKQDKLMKRVYDVVNKNKELKETAEAYNSYWNLNV